MYEDILKTGSKQTIFLNSKIQNYRGTIPLETWGGGGIAAYKV